jgi:adenylate kinase
MKRTWVILDGPVASGKGTLAKGMIKAHSDGDVAVIGTGEYSRQYVENRRPGYKEIDKSMRSGKYLPDDFIIEAAISLINEADKPNVRKVIFDSTFRTKNQSCAFHNILRDRKVDLRTVKAILINTPEEVCRARALERSKKENRSDDTLETVEVRLTEYREYNPPLRKHFERWILSENILTFEVTEMKKQLGYIIQAITLSRGRAQIVS